MFGFVLKRKAPPGFLLGKTIYINPEQIESITINAHFIFWQIVVVRMVSGRTYRLNPVSEAAWTLTGSSSSSKMLMLDQECKYGEMNYYIGDTPKPRK